MKKISIVASMAMVATLLTGCGNPAPKADMKTDIDTLSYAFGLERSQGIKQFLEQMEIDSTYIDDFVRGVSESAQSADDKKKAAYNVGISVGQQLAMMQKGYSKEVFQGDSTKSLSTKNLIAGFIAGATGKDAKMTVEEARTIGEAKLMAIQTAAAEKKYAVDKKKNEDWMAANAKKEGVKTLGKGVQYKVIKEGSGAIPKDSSIVTIKYEGKNIDGKVFDKNDNAKMTVKGAVPGFTEAITHMPVGSTWEIYIPHQAGYGARQVSPDLKPFSTMIFTVTLLSSEDAPQKPQIQIAPQGAPQTAPKAQ